MSKRTPTSPSQAHHRLMRALVSMGHDKDKLEPRPDDLNKVAEVFDLMGGSWQRLFEGSVDDMNLLKRTIKAAVKKGVLTEAPKWG